MTTIPIPLEKVLARPDVASELFFPIDRASWRERKRRYFVKRGDRRGVRSTIGGVRFQSSEHAEPGTSAVTDCQNDVVRLVRSLALIRKVPDLAEAVLSKDVLLNRQLGRPEGRRAKFGLFIPINGKFRDASDAARREPPTRSDGPSARRDSRSSGQRGPSNPEPAWTACKSGQSS